ncbi:MAG TPA: SGNH/GDSL hydrolase family protein, partial [Smithellaceae bacterium]|nr:SGNH/GDSL hydrolase family protein [Smithellaceae bacterium]
MKLLIRGGSVAAGHAAQRGYADILQDRLRPRGIEVINRSRFQQTSFDGIETFDQDIDCFRPDVLLLHFGVDDAFDYVYRSEFQENIVRIVRRA